MGNGVRMQSPEEVKRRIEPLTGGLGGVSPTNTSWEKRCGLENETKITSNLFLELRFSAKLVLIKASFSYELFASGQAQTVDTFIHINPTDRETAECLQEQQAVRFHVCWIYFLCLCTTVTRRQKRAFKFQVDS